MSYNRFIQHTVLPCFGLAGQTRLPDEGHSPITLNLIWGPTKAWITPKRPLFADDLPQQHRRRGAARHRILVECPQCSKVLSCGRLHQHMNYCHGRT